LLLAFHIPREDPPSWPHPRPGQASEAAAWETSFAAGSDVPERVGALVALIQAWQTPQEIIETAFLPPFLRDPEPDEPAA
jgi:hypothetical protein